MDNIGISRTIKFVVGGFELFMGIPFIGGIFVLSFAWYPLFVAFVLHIIAIIFSVKEKKPINGNVIGVVTCFIAFMPFIGMIMHIITAIVVLIEALENKK